MKVIHDFVENAYAIQIVIDYDVNIVCTFLLKMFFHLNHGQATKHQLVPVEDDEMFFGQTVSSDDGIMSTLKNEVANIWTIVNAMNRDWKLFSLVGKYVV